MGMAAPDPWFLRPRPNDGARLRLFCFPYAGGSSNIFRGWTDRLPESLELFGVRLPGRDQRIRERPFTEWPPLMAACRNAFMPYLDKPYALFGHSFGGSLAFTLAQDLQERGMPRPERILISACRCPHVRNHRPDMHRLPKPAFFARVAAMNGVPSDVLGNETFMDVIEPMLRADMQLAETWPEPQADRLLVPIDAFCGSDDDIAPPKSMQEWGRYTRQQFQQHVFPGGHFFIHRDEPAVLRKIAEVCAGVQ